MECRIWAREHRTAPHHYTGANQTCGLWLRGAHGDESRRGVWSFYVGEGDSSVYTCTSSLDCSMARRFGISGGAMSRWRLVLDEKQKTTRDVLIQLYHIKTNTCTGWHLSEVYLTGGYLRDSQASILESSMENWMEGKMSSYLAPPSIERCRVACSSRIPTRQTLDELVSTAMAINRLDLLLLIPGVLIS